MGLLGEGERDPSSTDALPAGYDSTAAVELADRLPTDDASTAVVLLTSEESLTSFTNSKILLYYIKPPEGGFFVSKAGISKCTNYLLKRIAGAC